MIINNLDKKKNFIIDFVYVAFWLVISVITVKFSFEYLLPFVIGVIIAYLVQKPAASVSKSIKLKKSTCAAILSVFFYIVVVAFFSLIFWLIYLQGNKLIEALNENGSVKVITNKLLNYISIFSEKFKNDFGYTIDKIASETSNELIIKTSNIISNTLSKFVKKLPDLLISTAITVVSTFYISKDYDKLKKFVLGVINFRICEKIIEVKNIFIECFLKFSKGYLLLYIITFFELVLGLMFLKVSNYVLYAFLISFVDLLPVFGTGTILIPWAIINFFQNDFKLGIGLTVLYIIIVVIRNFLEPKIIGRQVGINPIFTLIFIFLGFRLGGFIGLIFVPIFLTVIFTYYRQQTLDKNN